MIFEFKDSNQSVLVLSHVVETWLNLDDEQICALIEGSEDRREYQYNSEEDAKTDYKRLKEAFKKFHEPIITSSILQPVLSGETTAIPTQSEEKKYL